MKALTRWPRWATASVLTGIAIVLAGAAGAEPLPRELGMMPLQVGEDVVRRIETPHPYRDVGLVGGGDAIVGEPQLLWRDEIHHPGASYVCPHFERFELAPGDYVVVRSPDGRRQWRYEGTGKADMGVDGHGFWAIHIAGERAIIELYGRGDAARGYGYSIDRYARGYDRVEMALAGYGRALCGADDTLEAKCYEVVQPEIFARARSVARLLINGSKLCTGFLIGSDGHLLTTQQCINSDFAAANTNYEFIAQGNDCAVDCRFTLACPGHIAANTGIRVRSSVELDYTLVKLQSSVNNTYGYLRMHTFEPFVGQRIYSPQHPLGWGKQVAVASSHPQNPLGIAEIDSIIEAPCDPLGSELEAGYYMDTQAGSEGAPVLSFSDHLVVALHHCGGAVASCGAMNRGIPTPLIIVDMGTDLPPDSIAGLPPGTLFADGFESGNTSAWSQRVP